MNRHDRDQDFEAFVLAAWPRLRRAAYLLTHDTDEAEDLVQSVLVRCYATWERVRRDGAYSYVHRALVNGAIDNARRRRPLPLDDEVLVPVVDASGAERSGGGFDRADERSELSALLAPLSARERAIVVWRYYLDASETEVAEEFGIAPGTVKSTASRALARLRATHPGTTKTITKEEG